MKFFNLSNVRSKQFITAVLSAATVIVILLFIIFGQFSSNLHSSQGFYFDTVTSITIYDRISDRKASSLFQNINSMMAHYENLFSRTNTSSEIYAVNHSSGQKISISCETGELIRYGLDFAALSNGTVDPTVGALSTLWNIGSSNNDSIPTEEEIAAALATVDYHNVILEKKDSSYDIQLTNPDTMLDLGFIAKGYIADKIKEYLKSQGIKSAIINLGGNVLTIGHKPGKDCFYVGIKDPDNTTATIHTVSVDDLSVVSSGDYERYVDIDGQRYHHILSTATGYPAESDIHQVTIISESSLQGDALSTLCFILGKEKASEFIKQNYPDIQILF